MNQHNLVAQETGAKYPMLIRIRSRRKLVQCASGADATLHSPHFSLSWRDRSIGGCHTTVKRDGHSRWARMDTYIYIYIMFSLWSFLKSIRGWQQPHALATTIPLTRTTCVLDKRVPMPDGKVGADRRMIYVLFPSGKIARLLNWRIRCNSLSLL